MSEEKFKERFTIPTRYDVEPFGTIVKFTDEQSYELWIQLSKDEEHPDWKKLRYLLEKTFEQLFNDKEFIELCLEIYTNKDKLNGEFDWTRLSNYVEKRSSY